MTSQVGMSRSQISVPAQSSENPTKNASQDLRLRACRFKEPKLFTLFPKEQCLSSDIARPSWHLQDLYPFTLAMSQYVDACIVC